MLSKKIISILTSVDQAEQAKWMSQELLKKRFAACIQQTSGISTYHWQGELECTQEYYLHIKTTPDLKEQVITWLEQHHPYEIPEIVVLEGACSKAYGAWLSEETLKI
ncbi:MAG: divalent-cation tolerance protein CutA [Mariprofundaceae bacterium]|nr:divalent-cation tolerance protein CutA [Mariprofundaceae bacterium]